MRGGEGAVVQTRRRTTIRWDRLGRLGLAAVLGVILLLYISPAKHWIEQSRTYDEQHSELRDLTRQNHTLKRQVRTLATPGALEREARRLGMVREGERAYVIENLPTR
jgi:cell division protein FtsB